MTLHGNSIRSLLKSAKELQKGLRCISHEAVRHGIVGMVGRTPLVRINNISDETGCEILAKAEFCNGGGSVKDRAALFLIKDAIKKGQLRPGGTVVEGTAGNTGIGLAHMCLAMGYKCVIYMPNNQSQEKIDMLKTLGADVRPCPVVAWTDDNNYNHQARRFAESLDNAVWTNQFDNTANRQAHIETTGPEIWQDTKGKVNAVVFATGTGGTLAGTGIYLKDKNPKVEVICADPQGSVLFNWYKHGKLERSEGSSITEGIGQGRVTENMKGAPVDDAMTVLDQDVVEMTFRLLAEEGFFVGASSGLNVSAAYQLAKQMGPGHTIVTCLCDTGQRYYAKLFSKQVLQERAGVVGWCEGVMYLTTLGRPTDTGLQLGKACYPCSRFVRKTSREVLEIPTLMIDIPRCLFNAKHSR